MPQQGMRLRKPRIQTAAITHSIPRIVQDMIAVSLLRDSKESWVNRMCADIYIYIYANHQRIWLATFKSEKEAAMACDSAGRSGDSHTNFPWTDITIQEPNFQSQFSTEAVGVGINL
uniref:AP2/ERF domain-containing protein n=1 Tax=Davidia involucrata TaxID=16924 RepID=A0A5B7CG69_DAVIN